LISKTSEQVVKEFLGIHLELDDLKLNEIFVKVIDTSTLPTDIVDSITFEIAVNPYFITTGTNVTNTQYHLLDRKMFYHVVHTKINPFTREEIDQCVLEQLNQTPEVMQMRKNVYDKIISI
jgi:hypothetical protein